MSEVAKIKVTPAKSLVKEVLNSIEELHKNENLRRVLTGFIELDRLLWGFQPGSINLIASYNHGGRIALASNICKQNAFNTEQKINVGIVATPERATTFCRDFILQEADQSEQDMACGPLNTAAWNKLMTGARVLADSRLNFFELIENKSVQDLAPVLKETQTKLLLIDASPIAYYHPSEKVNIRRQMQKLKELATECNTSILILGEMAVASTTRDLQYPPQLKDIVAIDSLLPALTTVIILDQKSDCQPINTWLETDFHSKELVNVIVAYNDGEVGHCKLHYQPALKKFSDYSGIDDEDIPPAT